MASEENTALVPAQVPGLAVDGKADIDTIRAPVCQGDENSPVFCTKIKSFKHAAVDCFCSLLYSDQTLYIHIICIYICMYVY
jgi:hypothetical protein